MDVAARTEELAQGVAAQRGLEVCHVEFVASGASPTLRVYIDKPGGVNLDDCQQVSRHLGVLIEMEDYIESQYVLEVSSPGIERPLFKPGDYSRHLGHEVRLIAVEKIDGRRKFRGIIRDFQDEVLSLESEGRLYQIPFPKIKKANLVYEFDQPMLRHGRTE